MVQHTINWTNNNLGYFEFTHIEAYVGHLRRPEYAAAAWRRPLEMYQRHEVHTT